MEHSTEGADTPLATEPANHQRVNDRAPLAGRWLRATFYGWVLGFFLIVGMALIWDVFGGAQFMIGLGMGAGVGYMQGRVIKPLLGGSTRWLLSSIVGLGLPFLVWDLSGPLQLSIPFSLAGAVVVGSVLVGVFQWLLLRGQSRRAGWWIPASVVGWSLPVLLIALGDGDSVLGPWGSFVSTGAMLLGGLILGAIGGHALKAIVAGAPGN